MKHYRIGIEAGSHMFEFSCNTISEVYDAVQDASIAFGIDIDCNKIMVVLVRMDAGVQLSMSSCGLSIHVRDGEV